MKLWHNEQEVEVAGPSTVREQIDAFEFIVDLIRSGVNRGALPANATLYAMCVHGQEFIHGALTDGTTFECRRLADRDVVVAFSKPRGLSPVFVDPSDSPTIH
jgi:hypothetical protein